MPCPPSSSHSNSSDEPARESVCKPEIGAFISLASCAAILRRARGRKRDKLMQQLLAGHVIAPEPYDGLAEDLAALARYHLVSDVISDADAAMPSMLSAIPDSPVALFCDGDTSTLERPAVAVIGARRASRFGIVFAEQLGRDLALAGLTVVSGLAYGIDAAAHRGALSAADDNSVGFAVQETTGATIAVLGSGLKHIYPASNRGLADRIRRQGCLVSEYLPYTPPAKHRFPERNRIVSGLSSAVIVVEAGERSGSLITARLALEQGRDVFAVPGPPGNELSAGCHRLIRQGAALITSAEQVLAELPDWARPDFRPQRSASATEPLGQLSRAEQEVLLMLSSEPEPLERLAQLCRRPLSELQGMLAGLELAGFVEATVHGYIRRPPG